jgi:hypothetical protein
MRIDRWDVLAVAGAAALSAALFVGPGRLEAEAVGPAAAAQAPAKPSAEFNGCKVTAEPGQGASVTVRAGNPGASEVSLYFQIVVEKQEMNPEAAMSRAITLKSFKFTKVAEQTVTLAVQPGKTGEIRLSFNLGAGSYTVSAVQANKKVALCALAVAGTPKKAA